MYNELKKKVLAYITRKKGNGIEILIHRHRDYPEAGYQVPAGTVEEDESIEEALLREVLEESGLSGFKGLKKIGENYFNDEGKSEIYHRFFYTLEISQELPDKFEHIVSGNGEDSNLIFIYEWVNIKTLPQLAVEQDAYIGNI